jgi:serine/threonine protein kinase
MGEVFFGRDKQEDRICAVKIHLKAGEDHFVEEVASWILISGHPNIVEAFCSNDHNGRQYLLMEYVPGFEGIGPTLRDHFRAGRLTLKGLLDYSLQFCEGMKWAAKRVPNIVHRDIKPDNILIDHTGTLKISDWGLVAGEVPMSSQGNFTVDGETVISVEARHYKIPENAHCGTPFYMSPEQFTPETVSVRSDVYSFGCTLYEMLAGRLPFICRAQDLANAHLHTKPEPLETMLPAVNHKLSAIVNRCLAKAPEDRFENFAELQQEIAEIYETETGERWKPKAGAVSGVRVQIERVIGLSNAGKQETAYEVIQRIVEAHPDDGFAVFTKANVLRELNRREDAIEIYKQVLAMDEEQSSVWYNLGLTYFEIGEESEGRKCLENAVRLGHDGAREALRRIDKGGIIFIH